MTGQRRPSFVWFAIKSWSYLGCNRGTGRWEARRRWLTGLRPAWTRFSGAYRADLERH